MRNINRDWLRSYGLAQILRRLMEIMVALLPTFGIFYLHHFQNPDLCFEEHLLHELAIGFSTLIGSIISYIAWRCYLESGEWFVKWLTLGFIGFTLVYSLHGFFTPLSGTNPALFLFYGPVSRLIMSFCLLIGILGFGRMPDSPETRHSPRLWLLWIAACLGINILLAIIAHGDAARNPLWRMVPETLSAVLCLLSLISMWRLSVHSSLMAYYGLALAYFSQASLAFMDGKIWNHQWWQAHAIFAVGFCLLGYGVLRAYLTTHSFEKVFTERELFDDLATSNCKLHTALEKISAINLSLEQQVQRAQSMQTQFENLFSLSPDAILVVGVRGRVLRANPQAATLFAYSLDALCGLTVESLIPEEFRTDHARKRELYEYSPTTRNMGGNGYTLDCLRQDGSRFKANISLSAIHFDGEKCVVVFIREAMVGWPGYMPGTQHAAGQEMLSLLPLLDYLGQHEKVMLFQLKRTSSGHYRFCFVGGNCQKLIGTTADTLLANARNWFACMHPADLPQTLTTLEQSAACLTPWYYRWHCLPEQTNAPTPEREAHALPVRQAQDDSIVWNGLIRAVREE